MKLQNVIIYIFTLNESETTITLTFFQSTPAPQLSHASADWLKLTYPSSAEIDCILNSVMCFRPSGEKSDDPGGHWQRGRITRVCFAFVICMAYDPSGGICFSTGQCRFPRGTVADVFVPLTLPFPVCGAVCVSNVTLPCLWRCEC